MCWNLNRLKAAEIGFDDIKKFALGIFLIFSPSFLLAMKMNENL